MAAIVDERLAARTKVCNGCDTDKTWAEFWAKEKHPDGRMKRPQSICKDCQRAAHRARQAARRDRARRDYEFDFYEREREWSSRSRVRRAALEPELDVDLEPAAEVRLPLEPFRDWLRLRLLQRGTGAVARELGVDPRTINDWFRRNRTIGLDEVDAMLCRIGRPDLLQSLWPDV